MVWGFPSTEANLSIATPMVCLAVLGTRATLLGGRCLFSSNFSIFWSTGHRATKRASITPACPRRPGSDSIVSFIMKKRSGASRQKEDGPGQAFSVNERRMQMGSRVTYTIPYHSVTSDGGWGPLASRSGQYQCSPEDKRRPQTAKKITRPVAQRHNTL